MPGETRKQQNLKQKDNKKKTKKTHSCEQMNFKQQAGIS